MRVIERYILGRAFVLFLSVFSATLAVVWITQALTRINLITTNGQSTLVFLHISTLTLPSIIPEVLPFAVVIAVAQTLVAMNTDSELVVINASGGSRSAVIRPMVMLGLGVSLVAFLVANVLDPYARLQFREMVGAARADLISLVIQENSFSEIEEGLYIQVAERLPGGDLAGVFVADSREPSVDLIYYAKRGSLVESGEKKLLVMEEGMIQRETPNGEVAVIRFDSYAFDLSPFGEAGRLLLRPKDRSLAYLWNPDPEDLVFRKVPGEFRAELHRRLVSWSFPLVFALIGLVTAAQARARGDGRVNPLITAVTLALLVRWLAFISVDAAEKSASSVIAIYAVPVGAALVAIVLMRADRSIELSTRWMDRLGGMFRRPDPQPVQKPTGQAA